MSNDAAVPGWFDRSADLDVLAACADLHAQAFPADPWGVESLGRVLAMPGAFGVVVPAAATPPAGFGLARVAADEAEILTLAVAPGRRREGLGRRLVGELAARAGQLGASWLFLEVAATNHPARALYRACGFAACGYRPGYYDGATDAAADALVLVRELSDAAL